MKGLAESIVGLNVIFSTMYDHVSVLLFFLIYSWHFLKVHNLDLDTLLLLSTSALVLWRSQCLGDALNMYLERLKSNSTN